jgi:hypothetical protein
MAKRRRFYKQKEQNPFWSWLGWIAIALAIGFLLYNVVPGAKSMMGGELKHDPTGGVVGATKGLGKKIADKF